LTYPNLITFFRILLVPFFVVLLLNGYGLGATVVFAVAGISDGLDGLLARRLGQRSVLGAYLDPLADKVLLTAAFVALTLPSVPVIVHIPVWLTILTVTRDVIIGAVALAIRRRTGHISFTPSALGKITTVTLLLLVGFCLLANIPVPHAGAAVEPLVYGALALTLLSGFHYAFLSARIVRSYRKSGESHGGQGPEGTGN